MTDEEAIEAIKLLAGNGAGVITDRKGEYGDPKATLALFGELNRAVVKGCIAREANGYEPLDPGVEGSLCLLQLKVARVVAAPKMKKDTILDMFGYCATLAFSWLTAKKT